MITDCIFDFDGTLVDSISDVVESLKKAFDRHGISPESFDTGKIMQLQLKEAIAAIVPGITAEQKETVVNTFREIYDSSDYPNTTLMPGVAELLPRLKEKAIAMYIVSNKRNDPTLKILDKFNLRRYFTDVLNSDLYGLQKPTSKPRLLAMLIQKHAIDPNRAIYVGDSPVDVTAAKENDLCTVIVANGYGNVEGFAVKPDHTVQRVDEVLEMIR